MMSSKRFILTLPLLCIALLSSACFKAQTKGPTGEEDNASFYLEEVKGSSAISSVDPKWGLPNAKQYSFTVCAKDMHTQESIRDHKFIIKDSSGKVIDDSLRSRQDGCLSWSENIKYNFIADSKYVPLIRYVKAEGVHTGQRRLAIGINPWVVTDTSKGSFSDVVDLGKQKLDPTFLAPETEGLLYLNGEKKMIANYRRLYIDGMIVNISSVGAGSNKENRTIKLDMAPQILLHNLNGKIYGLPISKGEFNVVVHIISKIIEGDKVKRVHLGTTVSPKPQSMIGERLRFDLPLTQTYGSGQGQLEFAIKLIPVDGPADVVPFEGVFLIGSYKTQSVFSGNVPSADSLKSDYTYKIEDYLKTVSKPDPRNLPNGIFPIQPFDFSYITFPFAEVNTSEETPTSRTISILMVTKVTNPLENNDVLRNVKFTIVLSDGTEVTSYSDKDGVLSWRETITYKTLAAPHWFFKQVTIKHDASGFKQTIPTRLNPWSKNGFSLGNDLRQLDEKSKTDVILAKSILKPQTIMGKYVMALNENVDYTIYQDLTVESNKSFIINLAPYILPYSNPIEGLEANTQFRDGVYLLKVGVVGYVVGQKLVTTAKKLVILRNGQINEQIRLTFPDLRQMRIRNLIYVELHPVIYKKLSPLLVITKGMLPANDKIPNEIAYGENTNLDDLIDHDSGLDPRTFVGVFTPFAAKGEGPLRPTDDLDELVQNRKIGNNDSLSSPIDDLLPVDDLNENYKSDSAFKLLLKDPNFKPGNFFASNAKALEFISHMSIKDYTPINVSMLEKEEREIKAHLNKENSSKFKMNGFINHANAEYVGLNFENETYKYFPALLKNNKFINPINAEKNFLKIINQDNYILGFKNRYYPDNREFNLSFSPKPPYEVTREELRKLLPEIKGNALMPHKSIEPLMATRLCNYWINRRIPGLVFESSESLMRKCIDRVTDGNVNEVFVLDQKLRVFKKGKDYKLYGYYTRLNVGSDYKVSYGHSNSESATWAFSPMGFINSFRGASFVSQVFGFTWNPFQHSESWDTSYGKSSNLGANTSISTEEAQFKLILKEYERCSIVRMNPKWMDENKMFDLARINMPPAEKIKLLNRGVMFCSGELEKTPLIVDESVYYMTPDPFDGSLLEITDPKNYHWVVDFRGHRDYTQILDLLQIKGIIRNKSYSDLRRGVDDPKAIDANARPTAFIDPAIHDFKGSFGGIVTTYPGIYTVP